jgi:pilus assembly protein CpaB
VNPRQRRGYVLIALAAIGALSVFFSIVTFVGEVNAKVGNLASVVALVKPVRAYQVISSDMVELRDVPAKWLPGSAITDARDVIGLVPTNDLPVGTYAQRGMFVDRPGIGRGYREVAILVDAETGVAGKISPGSRVDILVTREAEKAQQAAPQTQRTAEVWVSNALIIEVGLPETVSRRSGSDSFGSSSGKAVPVTFALPIQDALKVAYAESFAVKVRLALRGGGDTTAVAPGTDVYPSQAAPSAATRPVKRR